MSKSAEAANLKTGSVHYVKFFPDFLSIFELEKFLLHF